MFDATHHPILADAGPALASDSRTWRQAEAAIAVLPDKTVDDFRADFRRVFGEPMSSRHKVWLVDHGQITASDATIF